MAKLAVYSRDLITFSLLCHFINSVFNIEGIRHSFARQLLLLEAGHEHAMRSKFYIIAIDSYKLESESNLFFLAVDCEKL